MRRKVSRKQVKLCIAYHKCGLYTQCMHGTPTQVEQPCSYSHLRQMATLDHTLVAHGEGGLYNGLRPLNSTRRHGHFLNSTCDMEPSDTRKNIRDTIWGVS